MAHVSRDPKLFCTFLAYIRLIKCELFLRMIPLTDLA
jgi:hypothetical protein